MDANLDRALQDKWRERVKTALTYYKAAQAAYRKALKESADMPSPDAALYVQRALHLFNAMLVHGKIPPDE